jgi:WD40 repeat protein
VERRVERKWRLGLTVSVGAVIVVGMKFNKGDVVNYGFNGDYYTVTVVEVSESGHQVRVQSADGELRLFTRRRNGSYRSSGHGTWLLSKGAREERNPSF